MKVYVDERICADSAAFLQLFLLSAKFPYELVYMIWSNGSVSCLLPVCPAHAAQVT